MKPYKFQWEAVEAALKNHRGIISAPTGTGKSLIIKLLIGTMKVRTLVIVPTLEIKRQMQDTLKEYANIVTIENIGSSNLIRYIKFDMLIIDEGHHSAAKTYHNLNKNAWQGIYYRFFFTATPFRNDDEETLLFEAICGQVIYKLNYKDAIKNNYIVPIEPYYFDLPKQKTDAFTWNEVYSELVVNNETRNTVIANTLKQLQQINIYTLCLVKEIAHGNILSEMTGIPFVNGEDDSSSLIQEFNKGQRSCLIATEGVMGEGIDTKPCEYVIIAGLGKAKSAFMQKCGRGVRKYQNKTSCKIILFRDKSHKYLLRHYNEQCTILKEEYGVKPVELEIL